MGETRLRRTIGNWRWWACLPLMLTLTPLIAVDLALAALETAGEEAGRLRRWVARKLAGLLRQVRRWATPPDPQEGR